MKYIKFTGMFLFAILSVVFILLSAASISNLLNNKIEFYQFHYLFPALYIAYFILYSVKFNNRKKYEDRK
jgi:uncharacterized membrane protein